MNDEPTLPPVRTPNTPRKFIWIVVAWARAHPVAAAACGGIFVGALLPSVVRWWVS